MFLLDSNIISYAIRGNREIKDKINQYHDTIKLNSIIQAELFYGAYKIKSESLAQIYNIFFETFDILPFGSREATIFAQLKANLANEGKVVEDADLMIASVALTNNLTLVTNNTKHFARIPDLKLANWYIR